MKTEPKSVLEWFVLDAQNEILGPFESQEKAWADVIDFPAKNGRLPRPRRGVSVYCVRRQLT